MLGEKDLVFLGACFFLTRDNWVPNCSGDIELAVECSQKLFDTVFGNDKKNNDKMILE